MRFYEIRLLDHFHSGGFANNLLSNFFFYTLHPTGFAMYQVSNDVNQDCTFGGARCSQPQGFASAEI